MLSFSPRNVLAALLASSAILPATAVTTANAEDAYNALQYWYTQSSGLWMPSTGWWNSANCLTVIANLAAIDRNVARAAASVYTNTYTHAQQYGLAMQKVVTSNSMVVSYYADTAPKGMVKVAAATTNNFLNSYYDDEGWWALAWIAVYDVTKNQTYLNTAESIFEDMKAAYGTTNCGGANGGGIWWDKDHTYVNAIANELFLDVAAHLANRASNKAYYLATAQSQWTWFKNSGMINAQNNINDGLDQTTCKNNGGTVWSYNQGAILGGLTELSRATGDKTLITTAKLIADAAISKLTVNGILHDPCEPNCGGDGSQFKGVFARNLQILQQYSPETRYATFLDNNANSIWANDRSGSKLSLIWSGPYQTPANASTQSSALDAIVGSLAT